MGPTNNKRIQTTMLFFQDATKWDMQPHFLIAID